MVFKFHSGVESNLKPKGPAMKAEAAHLFQGHFLYKPLPLYSEQESLLLNELSFLLLMVFKTLMPH
jgi:hypothetical protein